MIDAPSLVLGIETSCDETAAAVMRDGVLMLSSVVSSQVDLHTRFGGVVPELAGRAHLNRMLPVLEETLERAGIDRFGRMAETGERIGAVAATVGPGLIGSLLVGVATAKSLALSWQVPFVGVNHLEGHLYAALIEDPEMTLPAVVLIVSGGHTLLIEMHEPGSYQVLGSTLDDAAGEAFDKVARYLGLSYPGGPAIEKAALNGDATAVDLPRPLLSEGLDFSFSGLKTAVVHYVDAHPDTANEDIAASFQAAVTEVLVTKAVTAAKLVGASSICIGGGVAANTMLREQMSLAGAAEGFRVYLPSRSLCTDNAAMIAAAGYFGLALSGDSPLDTPAQPNLAFPSQRHFTPSRAPRRKGR